MKQKMYAYFCKIIPMTQTVSANESSFSQSATELQPRVCSPEGMLKDCKVALLMIWFGKKMKIYPNFCLGEKEKDYKPVWS